LLGAITSAIFADHNIGRERLIELLQQCSHTKLLDRLLRESPFKRVAFLQPETQRSEVEEQFADLIYRFRALPNLSRELLDSADHLADVSDAEFERFAALQQQVAGIGQHHISDDAGEREAGKRFQETVARLKQEHVSGQRGRRPEKRG
jgi:DNA primase